MPQSALLKILDAMLVASGTTHGIGTGCSIFVAIGLSIASGTGVLVGKHKTMRVAVVFVVWQRVALAVVTWCSVASSFVVVDFVVVELLFHVSKVLHGFT